MTIPPNRWRRTTVDERIRSLDPWFVLLGILATVVAVAVLVPVGWMIREAFQVEVGRAISLMTGDPTPRIVLNSLTLMIGVTVASILIGVPLAYLTTRTDLPAPRLWTVVAALPLVVPSYIGAIAFVGMFGSGGQLDTVLGISLPQVEGLAGATFIITLYTYPYVFLTTRGAILSMDESLYDAARTLNVGKFRAFSRVTLPQIRPGIAAGALLAGLYAISDFGTPAFMRANVFTSRIYWEFEGFRPEYAALLALQLIAIVGMVLVIEAGIGHDADAQSRNARGTTVHLGRWKWIAMGGIALLGIVTLIVPILIFLYWFFMGEGRVIESLAWDWSFAYNSVRLSIGAALAAVLMALPVAYFSGRSSGRFARLVERITYIGFAVPGIVIGLALVFFGLAVVPGMYRTGVALLIFAYVVRFIPQAVGSIRSSVLQMDQRLLEASRTLNAGRFETFRRVTLPQIAPGAVVGAVLVFLTTMKELPMTLMLRPIGTDTLVIIIWDAQDILAYRYAAIPALVLIVVSGLTMLVMLRQESGRPL